MVAPYDLEVEFYILDAAERNQGSAFKWTRWPFVLYEMSETQTEAALLLPQHSKPRRKGAQ